MHTNLPQFAAWEGQREEERDGSAGVGQVVLGLRLVAGFSFVQWVS